MKKKICSHKALGLIPRQALTQRFKPFADVQLNLSEKPELLNSNYPS